MPERTSLAGHVGLFFVVKGRLLLHICPMDRAERYGDFWIYPRSHDLVWERTYRPTYGVDFDYFPRGRFAFDSARGAYRLYHDRCIRREAEELARRFPGHPVELSLDEHYQCHACNSDYVL